MVRGWHARRVAAKLRDEATVQMVAMEVMMKSIAMSDQWSNQHHLNKTDQVIADDQLQSMKTMMGQVTVNHSLTLVLQCSNVGDNKWITILYISPKTK